MPEPPHAPTPPPGPDAAPAPRVPLARRAARLVPAVAWFDALLLVVSSVLLLRPSAHVPGVAVDLPAEPFADGEPPSSIVLAVVAAPGSGGEAAAADGVPTLDAEAFFDDGAYLLARPARAAALRSAIAAAAAARGEKRAIVHLDGDIPHRDALRLARLLREAGIEHALLAVRPPPAGRP